MTAEELTAAVNALEADRQREAARLAGTVAIGDVVEELRLEATSEQIWAQVLKQRTEAEAPKGLHQAAAEARNAAVRAVAAARTPSAGRRRVRGWHEMKGWAWVLFWCCGGLGLITGVLHPTHPNTVCISGDHQSLNSATLGKSVEVSGDKDTVTLQGNCPTLTITGDDNHIRVVGSVGRVITEGGGNTVTYGSGPSAAPVISGGGDGNTVTPAGPTP